MQVCVIIFIYNLSNNDFFPISSDTQHAKEKNLFTMYENPACSFSNSSICAYDHFSKFIFFASIIERINIGIKPINASTSNTQASSGNIMILLADDDCDDRELFEEAISEINTTIKVKAVEDCYQLMQILKDTNIPLPDILFLDLNMPGMSGKQCLKEIKKDKRLNKLPVVIYSTSFLMDDIQDTYSIGANYYIQKPNSFKVAISLIRKVFSIDFDHWTAQTNLKNFVLSIDRN